MEIKQTVDILDQVRNQIVEAVVSGGGSFDVETRVSKVISYIDGLISGLELMEGTPDEA